MNRNLGENFKLTARPRPTPERLAECQAIYQSVFSDGFLPFLRTARTKANKSVIVEETPQYVTFSANRMLFLLVTMAKEERQPIEDKWGMLYDLANAGHHCYFGPQTAYLRLYKPQENFTENSTPRAEGA